MQKLQELRKEKGWTQEKFAKKLSVSRSTVAMWESGKSSPDNSAILQIARIFNVSIDSLLGNCPTGETATGVKIPVYGKVAAGIPINAIEDIIDYEEISADMANRGEYIALQIKGDSMEPKISNGDVVIVRLQQEASNGDIVIVLVNGDEATCKKIKITPEGVMLISTNPAYEPMFYSKKQVAELPVRIIGKVVELRAKF